MVNVNYSQNKIIVTSDKENRNHLITLIFNYWY